MLLLILLCAYIQLKKRIKNKRISYVSTVWTIYVMLCMIWYHSYNFKNLKNTHGGVLLSACNFPKSITPSWLFLKFLKLCKCYQIVQSISYKHTNQTVFISAYTTTLSHFFFLVKVSHRLFFFFSFSLTCFSRKLVQ